MDADAQPPDAQIPELDTAVEPARPGRHAARRWPPLSRKGGLLVAAEAAITVVVLAWLASRTGYRTPDEVGMVPEPLASVASGASAAPRHRVAPVAPGLPPRHLRVPRVGISAAVIPVKVDRGGALDVPVDVQQVGWWQGGARPGDPQGTVVIDGHVDSATQGRGQFFRLERAGVGDRVVVTTARGQTAYVVVARKVYRKAALPREIFTRAGRPRLVLITCGGAFNSRTRHYANNVVVYAVPAPVPVTKT
jgi:hypothetical protein